MHSALGTVAGLDANGLGVTWLDAHADFDDPEENTSGFFDVMALAMLTGRGWRALRETIPGHRPIAERDVILAAVRDLEPYQREHLQRSMVRAVGGAIDPERFEAALSELSDRVARVYLHVDLDALDVTEARANEYSAAGGQQELPPVQPAPGRQAGRARRSDGRDGHRTVVARGVHPA